MYRYFIDFVTFFMYFIDFIGQTKKKLVDAENDLNKFTSELEVPNLDINASVMTWKQQVQQFAKGIYCIINFSQD